MSFDLEAEKVRKRRVKSMRKRRMKSISKAKGPRGGPRGEARGLCHLQGFEPELILWTGLKEEWWVLTQSHHWTGCIWRKTCFLFLKHPPPTPLFFLIENMNSITVKRVMNFWSFCPTISFGKSREITLRKHSKVLFWHFSKCTISILVSGFRLIAWTVPRHFQEINERDGFNLIEM